MRLNGDPEKPDINLSIWVHTFVHQDHLSTYVLVCIAQSINHSFIRSFVCSFYYLGHS